MRKRIRPISACMIGLAAITVLISSCGPALEGVSVPENDGLHFQNQPDSETPFGGVIDMGCYTYKSNVGPEVFYTDQQEAPYVFIGKDTIRLFFPHWAYYSPWSSGGRHDGHLREYDYDPSGPSKDGMQLLTDSGIDASKIRSCTRYPLSEEELELLIVETDAGKEIWLAEWWKTDLPYVYEIEPTDRYQLNVETDFETGDQTGTMIDLAAPSMINLSDPSVSKDDVLDELRRYAEEDDRIVAAKYDQDEEKTIYWVFEYENQQLRSWVEYCFYDSESLYLSHKASILADNGDCNDYLLLTKVCYGYEVGLRKNLCGRSMEQMRSALKQEGFQEITYREI